MVSYGPARTLNPGATAGGLRSSDRRLILAVCLVSPLILSVVIVGLYPLIYLAVTSFTKSTLGRPFIGWVGFSNFVYALKSDFGFSLIRSVLFSIPTSVAQLILGLAIAILLDVRFRFASVARALLLIPLMTPPVMVGVAWKLMLHPSGGLVNGIFTRLNILHAPQSFLGETPWATLSIALADTWQWTPFVVLLVYAALQTLPHDLDEAARIDGAKVWQRFFHIKLPLLAPSLAAVFLLKLILSFKIFDLIYVLTAGGPGVDTSLATFKIWRTLFQDFNLGLASAETIIFSIFVGLITIPLSWFNKKMQSGDNLWF